MKKLLAISTATLISLGACIYQRPCFAFIPYIYEPKLEILIKTSVNLGKTAAHLIQLGQNNEAIRLALLAVRLNPTDGKLWALLAEAQIKDNQLSEAKKSLIKAKQLDPKKSSLWFAEGSIDLRVNQPKQAIKNVKHGLKLDPKNPGGYFQLGNAELMQLNFSSALKAFNQAVKLEPDFWEALNNQGLVLFEMGKPNKAIEKWREVLAIKENAEPLLALAAALNQINPGNKESIILARKALTLKPNYVSAKYQKHQLWGQRLRLATKMLLKNIRLISAVERAIANSD